jgi:hypothetical protein
VIAIALFVLARFYDGFDAARIPVHQVPINFPELNLLQPVSNAPFQILAVIE